MKRAGKDFSLTYNSKPPRLLLLFSLSLSHPVRDSGNEISVSQTPGSRPYRFTYILEYNIPSGGGVFNLTLLHTVSLYIILAGNTKGRCR